MLKTPFITIALIFSLLVARAGGIDSDYINVSEFVTIEISKSELICITPEQQLLTRLLNNKSHFVIAVKSYEADRNSSNGFKVSLVDMDGNSLSVTRFGIYPGEPFSAEDQQNYHRFAVSLPQNQESLGKLQKWCFKIELEPISKDEIYIEARAELRLEINHTVK